MKKTLHIALAAAAAALAAAGCAKVGESDAPEGQEITITASFAEDQTKTTLQDGGTAVYWEAGDEIKLFYDGAGSRFSNQYSELSGTAKFSGSLNVVFGSNEGFSDSTPLWGLYPYRSDATADNESVTTTLSSEQTGKAGSFAKGMNISLARSTSLSMGFYNVCGGVRFSVTRDDVTDVVFEALNGESIAGKVKLAFEGGVPAVQEVLEGVSSITLTAPSGGVFETGKWYYIVALPGSLSGGFRMTFNTETKYATLKSSKSVTVKRGVFGSLADADEGLIYRDKGTPEPEYVDLGLSVKWATCNIGASKPEEYGTYFAWGDVSGQTWNGSTWSGGGFSSDPEFKLDANNNLKPEYDAAHVNWGGTWRMPTKAEQQELIDNCTSTWTNDYNGTGVAGRIFTSNKEGYTDKSIFLPAAGNGNYGGLNNAGDHGDYWSSTSDGSGTCDLEFGSSFLQQNSFYRHLGYSVRPVYGEYIPVTSISLSETSASLAISSTKQLTAAHQPENASLFTISWSSSNEEVATVSSDGLVAAVGAGQCTITASVGTVKAECAVTVTDPASEPTSIDLGLSVKWATFNVGASKPEDYGRYFAWGDVVGQTRNGSSWSDGGFSDYPEYELDANGNLNPEYDAAHVNWGGTWRMPTKDEYQELLDNCTSTWTSNYNGTRVSGRVFTSNMEGYTDRSIFLPAAGFGNSSDRYYANYEGHYRASTFCYDRDGCAWGLYFPSGFVHTGRSSRDGGCSVRPVTE